MKTSQNIELDFASLELLEGYAISTIKEGVSLNIKQLNTFFDFFNQYYLENPFVSIANRKFDYNIDPNLLKSKNHPGILGIGVVCYNKNTLEIAKFEKKFYKGPFEIFESMDEAIHWAETLHKHYLKKAGL